MALDRGERGYRGDHLSRGTGPARDQRDYEEQDRGYFRGREEEEYPYSQRAPEPRHWRGSEYENAEDSPDRGRSYRDYGRDNDRLIDIRHRHGFLRGESRGRYSREDDWRAGESRGHENLSDRERWRGPYAGRGPKNYRRSDERIYEEVCERLMEHPAIDASDIEVSVSDGDVTLSGRVENRAVKHLTEVMTETVSGVKEVHNQLRVATHHADDLARR